MSKHVLHVIQGALHVILVSNRDRLEALLILGDDIIFVTWE